MGPNLKSFLGGSNGKESAYNAEETRFDPWVGKIPWTKKGQPTPVFLPGESHGQRSLVGLDKGSDTTEPLNLTQNRH